MATIAIFYRLIGKSPIIDKRSPYITVLGALSGLVVANADIVCNQFIFPSLRSYLPAIYYWGIYYIFAKFWIYSYFLRVVYLTLADYVNIRQRSGTDNKASKSSFELAKGQKETEGKTQKMLLFVITALCIFLRVPRKRDSAGRLVLSKNIYSTRYILKTSVYFVAICLVALVITIFSIKDHCPQFFTANISDFICKAEVSAGYAIIYSTLYLIMGILCWAVRGGIRTTILMLANL